MIDVHKYFAAIDAHGRRHQRGPPVPHGTVRSAVMGNANRPPSLAELERMKRLVERGMEAGAWGLSSGLIYVPGRYASTSELIELAKVAHRHGGIYASHIRSEGAKLLESIDEAIAIGKGASIPVHISHLKASGKATGALSAQPWIGSSQRGEPVRSSRPISILTWPRAPSSPRWSCRTGRSRETPMILPGWPLTRNEGRCCVARSSECSRYATEGPRSGSRGSGRGRIGPGSTWSRLRNAKARPPLEIVLDIQRNGGAQAISFGMSETDVREVMRHEFVATASDGRPTCLARAINRTRAHTGPFPARFATHSTTS